MALSNTPNRNFFDKKELLDRKLREELLFRDFSSNLKKIASLSSGWKEILIEIDLKFQFLQC